MQSDRLIENHAVCLQALLVTLFPDMSKKKLTRCLLAATICSCLLIVTAVIMSLMDISLLGKSIQPPKPGATVWDTSVQANVSLPRKKSLSPSEIDGVKKLVMFIGNGRSGTSIIGSMMNAHPNVVIRYEYQLFRKWLRNPHMSKAQLFNDLYALRQRLKCGNPLLL